MTTFDFNGYQANALRTNSTEATPEENLHHALMGLTTEIAELVDAYKRHYFYHKPLDVVNIKEEVGDVLWYLAIGYHAISTEPKEGFENRCDIGYDPECTVSTVEKLIVMMNTEASLAYSSLIYGPVDGILAPSFDDILAALDGFVRLHGFTLQEAADMNVEKLRKRYPQGFNDADAVNRDKENELSHIS